VTQNADVADQGGGLTDLRGLRRRPPLRLYMETPLIGDGSMERHFNDDKAP